MKRKSNNTHITLEGRKFIQEELEMGSSVSEIAMKMCRSKSTITREIDRHITLVFPSNFNNYHPCLKSQSCPVKEINCYETCKNLEINLCPKLTSSPHTCNGCQTKRNCRYVKRYYNAIDANNKYLNDWKNDRIGLRYSNDELQVLNNDFYNLVISTRSIYHSLQVINNRGFNFKERTIYHQIKNGKLKLKYSDLPRNRKQKKENLDKDYKNKESIEGHTYEDYTQYKKQNENAIESQMDTVIGIQDSRDPVILTLEIIEISFMFIFKLEHKTFNETLNKLIEFKNKITIDIFNNIFNILLTDNGSEFKTVSKIVETFPNINIFYCHPYASYEKGNIENNHELLRRVIPKGVSLKHYTQKDYNLLASHINSLYRKKLDGKCPFDSINNYIPIDTLNELGLTKISDDLVNLTPSLLGNKNIENIKKYLTNEEIIKANISLNYVKQEDFNE